METVVRDAVEPPGWSAAGLVVALTLASLAVSARLAGGPVVDGVPLMSALAALALGIQWLAYVPAYLARSERFYDLIGSLTYLLVTGLALAVSAQLEVLTWRGVLAAALVWIWALRLGSFLFARVRREGGDGRFDAIKRSAPRFLIAWTLQGLWVFWTALAALILITGGHPAPAGPGDLLGPGLWLLGFGIELVADRQKAAFRRDPANQGRWIDVGLWAWSRHPNYFGEITLWTGLAVMGAGVFRGGEWVGLISPLFVAALLTQGSGIPILEARADARWGHDPAYQDYKRRVPVLVPRPPRS